MVKDTRELILKVYRDQTIVRRSVVIFRPDGWRFLAIFKGDKDQAGNRIDQNREDPQELMVIVTMTESALLTIE